MVIDDLSPPGAWARDLALKHSQRAPSERELQRMVIQLLGMRGFLCVHVPNGIPLGANALTRSKIINAMKKDGLRPGFPDLIVFSRSGGVGVLELKRAGLRGHKNEGLSAEQGWWKDELTKRGINWARLDSIDDLDAVLRGWGWTGGAK